MKFKSYSHGKVILFGEHFAVYGAPALAAKINRGIEVTVETGRDIKTTTIKSKYGEYELAENRQMPEWCEPTIMVLNRFRTENSYTGEFKISVKGSLPKGCGSGSATVSAIVKALHGGFNQELPLEKLVSYINQTDKLLHGKKPSGIDAYAVALGGYVFMKNKKVYQLEVSPLKMILCDSGIKSKTSEQVKKFMKFKKNEPEMFEFEQKYTSFINSSGKLFLETNNMEGLGDLMYYTHETLDSIGMSCGELNEIIGIARKHKAYGAKLTGAGGGGAAIILPKENPKKLMSALNKRGYPAEIIIVG